MCMGNGDADGSLRLLQVPSVVQTLVQDVRRVMAPYTADNLREKRCVCVSLWPFAANELRIARWKSLTV